MKRILVAGGAGFIGSHLGERLHQEGHTIYALDNVITGSWKNVEHLQDQDRFHTLEQDVSLPFDFTEPLDEIYHLASPASPVDFERLNLEIMAANARGTEVLLALAKEKGARFLFASTSEVYGNPEVHPQSETYWGRVNPVGVRSPYDESKRYGEAYTTAFCSRHDVSFSIARIFNTYGPRMPGDGRVMHTFIHQALAGENLSMFGDGSQTRSFCFVSDMVTGLIAVMQAAKGEPINLGSTEEITIKRLAYEVVKITGSTSRVGSKPLPPDDPLTRRPDITKAHELLGWSPKVSLQDGIRQSIDHFS